MSTPRKPIQGDIISLMSALIVSVIIPTKNSSITLGDCLNSIKNQTYPNIELIIVDNFSIDNTPIIAKKYTNKFYSKGPERSPQRNYGVNKAKGVYVAIIDSDMNLSPDVIDECVTTMEDNPELAGVVIPEESFGEGFWAQCKKLERSFYIGVDYMEAARFFRRSDYEKLGGYSETMVSGEDWDLSQRMERLGRLDHITSLIRHNEGHISLWQSMKKKFYYAEKFAHYKNAYQTTDHLSQQTNIASRYQLFLSNPKKLFKDPLLGFGMLFMKTCEFGVGAAGYLKARIRRR
jgi:glycosyltransferase involved in cell wall biosynthesis